jgi:glycosyltransferase involved in cell wall biosynthesis
MQTPLSLSLVIPAYNEESHLAACLDAVSRQTVMPSEVIVVDNNSTDRTAEIAGSYPFVRVVNESRQGIVYARNAGFDAARSDIIGRIDADTIIPADWTQHVLEFFAEPAHAQTAWSGRGIFRDVPLPRLVGWAYELIAFYMNHLLVGHYTLWGSNMAVWQRDWRTVRGHVSMRTGIHEDLDVAMHLHAAGVQISYDRSIQTDNLLRRVRDERAELWDYLQWWPRTLRLHGKRSWLVCWLVGALGLYLAAYVLVLVDQLNFSSRSPRLTSLPERV